MLPLLFLAACGPALDGYDGVLPDDTGTVYEQPDWWSCDLDPGSHDGESECRWMTLPVDHDDPDGDSFEALVKRRPGTGSGQLWVMHGGPGGSAVDDLSFLPSGLLDARPDLTVYAVDHRGIGGSLRLGCAEESGGVSEDEWPACVEAMEAEHGDRLGFISTTASARDVGTLIEQLAGPDETVFVYGGSYGTYLALRYLQLFPDQPAGVVIDGISPPGDGFIGYDAGMSGVGEALMALCGQDASCAAHFEADPLELARGLAPLYDDGHCPALGANGDFIRYFTGSLLFYDKLRDLVPATVFRLQRCSDDDIDVIVTLYYAVNGVLGSLPAPPPPAARFQGHPLEQVLPPPSEGNTGDGFSYGLFYHVALSEMWYQPGDPAAEQVAGDWSELTMSTGLETWLAPKLDWWPRYERDPLWGQVADYGGPILMLQGGLDPATTPGPALELASHFTGPGQTLAYWPQGAHGMIGGSTLPEGGDCGQQLLQAFLAAPQSALDLGCIEQTQGVQWDGYAEYNSYFMGTQEVWGD